MKRDYDKDGGPAFGVHHPDIEPYAHGMTVRDWFAGQVLQGLCGSGAARDLGELWEGQRGWDGHSDPHKFIREIRAPQIAADCYAIADAMMRARDTANVTGEAALPAKGDA